MINTWTQLQRRLTGNPAVSAGTLAGLVGLCVSFAGRGLIPGRVLGDPLPLALSASQVTRGFTYFNWRAPLFHALFAALLGVSAAWALKLVTKGEVREDKARQAGRIAALINVGLVALLQVDAFIVAFWYLMAGAMSVLLTGFAAGRAARLLR